MLDYDVTDLNPPTPQDRQERRREAEALRERKLCNALMELASLPDGLLFLRWMIDQSHLLKAAYPGDHAQAAWREGQRHMGAQLMALARKAGVLPKLLEEDSHA